MAEPKIRRANTLQARFGFADPDLKKPEHDEIMGWLDANMEDILMGVLSMPGRPKQVKTIWEPSVRMNEYSGQIIGFVDMSARVNGVMMDEGHLVQDEKLVLFEAKTAIPSLGELFRQLQMYKAGYVGGRAVSGLKFVVTCPDDTDAQIIRDQGFHFLKYDPA